MSRAAAALAALAMVAAGVIGVLAVDHADRDRESVQLPDGGEVPAASAPTASPTGDDAARTPAPNDQQAAVPDVNPARTVSPAQGTVRLTVRAAPPGGTAGAAYQAYLGWVRAYLAAYARPGQPDRLAQYATPAAVAAVRAAAAGLAARGWAEYGSAVLVSAAVAPAGAGTVTVRACLDLSGLATRDAAGRLGGRDRPVGSTATLTAAGGHWRVSRDEKRVVAGCR